MMITDNESKSAAELRNELADMTERRDGALGLVEVVRADRDRWQESWEESDAKLAEAKRRIADLESQIAEGR